MPAQSSAALRKRPRGAGGTSGNRIAARRQEIDIADWMGKTALELIGQAGIGYSFGALEGRYDEYNRALHGLVCVRNRMVALT